MVRSKLNQVRDNNVSNNVSYRLTQPLRFHLTDATIGLYIVLVPLCDKIYLFSVLFLR